VAGSLPESLHSKLFRNGLNLWPCYWGTGGKLTHLSGDWHEARVRLRLTPRTRNYVGTIFGGSMYGSVDPIYMLMLIKILGPGYIVWDKAASIRFKKPGKGVLEAHFLLSEAEIESIRKACDEQKSVDRVYLVEYKDREGVVCASIEKTLYIRKSTSTSP
jgi:acyl-coenzyme A thioesterase PaaI-like protein